MCPHEWRGRGVWGHLGAPVGEWEVKYMYACICGIIQVCAHRAGRCTLRQAEGLYLLRVVCLKWQSQGLDPVCLTLVPLLFTYYLVTQPQPTGKEPGRYTWGVRNAKGGGFLTKMAHGG